MTVKTMKQPENTLPSVTVLYMTVVLCKKNKYEMLYAINKCLEYLVA